MTRDLYKAPDLGHGAEFFVGGFVRKTRHTENAATSIAQPPPVCGDVAFLKGSRYKWLMEPITAIATGLSATKTGLDLINALLKRSKTANLKAADYEEALRQLHDNLWEAKRSLQVADEDNQELRRQVQSIESDRAIKDDMQWQEDGGFWSRRSESEKGVCIRYCPTCFGEKGQLIPLAEAMTQGMFTCPNHDGVAFLTKAYRDREEERKRKALADENAFTVLRKPDSWMR